MTNYFGHFGQFIDKFIKSRANLVGIVTHGFGLGSSTR